jgi:flagellin
MSLVVNTNISSLNARRFMNMNTTGLDTSFQRLSSGFRINSAADDAAGLQISNRLTAQINGYEQGVRNANDGISLAQVAEGALDEMTNITQRMRVLVLQSKNGAYSVSDKTAIQTELDQLKKEFTRIASSTEFAGIKLLDGSLRRDFQVGADANQTIPVNLDREGGYTAESLLLSEVVVDGSDGISASTRNGILNRSGTSFTLPSPPKVGSIEGLQVSVNGSAFVPIEDGTFGNPYAPWPTVPGQLNFGANFSEDNLQIFGLAISAAATSAGFPFSMGVRTLAFDWPNNTLTSVGDLNLRFRIGNEAPDYLTAKAMQREISSMTGLSPEQVGLPWFEIEADEEDTIFETNVAIIDDAIALLGDARAKLGATQNRFQSAIRNISNVGENLQAARSRIRDTDYAVETAELTRRQILQQASATVLSQANQRPQAALSLLSG